MSGGRSKRRSSNNVENRMARAMDRLDDFDRYETEIAPKLRAMVERNAPMEEIYRFMESIAAARVATAIMTETDNVKALAAAKEILDRSKGKAKERIETEHRFGRMKDEELDALLESRLKEVTDDEPKSHGH